MKDHQDVIISLSENFSTSFSTTGKLSENSHSFFFSEEHLEEFDFRLPFRSLTNEKLSSLHFLAPKRSFGARVSDTIVLM